VHVLSCGLMLAGAMDSLPRIRATFRRLLFRCVLLSNLVNLVNLVTLVTPVMLTFLGAAGRPHGVAIAAQA